MAPAGLTRYGSAPGSLLTTAVDSVIGPNREFSALRSPSSLMGHQQYFSGDSSSITSESTCRANSSNKPKEQQQPPPPPKGLQRSCGLHEMSVGNFLTASTSKGGAGGSSASASSALVRQKSSPAGFLSHLSSASDNVALWEQCWMMVIEKELKRYQGKLREKEKLLLEKSTYYMQCVSSEISRALKITKNIKSLIGFLNYLVFEGEFEGFSVTRGSGGYNSIGGSNGGHGVSRLKSQLSFTGQDSLSQISEVGEDVVDGISSSNGHQNATHSYATTSFGMDSWENTNSIVFSAPPSKRGKNIDGDFFNGLHALETQFSMPQTTLEMATVEKLIHIPEDSVPCKIRAKRGCATHPRSIAERERRTRISGKLKKLQDLVPNMDKQTSYADMLDLAVQHIKGLQNHVQEECNI
ncbi:hypothetical protein CJ030_MR5G003540 [Morella rubra]|uniref:BHLH domain-containing protein n=1 Tax=Morella rubra TaxID=262757 RepID=A0A6A1VRQ5_9ROSI|nr:hypothetical protein CJ030_MR5G003540 [Morella rubra]